ncbi:cardiolipin synthase [Paenibacillus albiflavus]
MFKRSIQIVILLVVIVGMLYYTNTHFSSVITASVSIITSLTVLFVGLVIFMENRNPSSTMAWILILALVPVVGFIFYLLFGQSYRKRRKFDRKALQDAQMYLSFKNQDQRSDYSNFPVNQQKMFHLANNIAKSHLSLSTHTKVLTNGGMTFAAIVEELNKATHHIHIEYYIYRDDEIGKQIQNILLQKAKEGVKVRFLFDAVGSYKLPESFIEEMRAGGIEAIAFDPVTFPLFSSKVNYRNHRKIIVIDGQVGFIGGLNVGDEYLSRSTTYGFWRDTHLLVTGEAVRTLQFIFMTDWYHMTGKTYSNQAYVPPVLTDGKEDGAVQIIASGPDQQITAMKNLFFSMITSAEKSIWVATPYFIPDDDIFTALRVAAMSGIDVKILFPKKPDKWLPYLASHSYFPGLVDSGVNIYEYERGFMHSKILIVDGVMASIGTANMDMRSFHLNFEVNAFLYDTESTEQLVADYEADLADSVRLDSDRIKNRGYVVRFLESAARLMSPLL